MKNRRIAPGQSESWAWTDERVVSIGIGHVRIAVQAHGPVTVWVGNESGSAPVFVQQARDHDRLADNIPTLRVIAVTDTASQLPFARWEEWVSELCHVPFDRGEHAMDCARAQMLIEQILEAYAVATEPEREWLRMLYQVYPQFFHTAVRVLWQKADPLATARLHLLFYSLLDGGPDERDVWYIVLPTIIDDALNADPPVSRNELAQVLREVAAVSNRAGRSRGATPMAEVLERLAEDLQQ